VVEDGKEGVQLPQWGKNHIFFEIEYLIFTLEKLKVIV
jgi:hypothetical protein